MTEAIALALFALIFAALWVADERENALYAAEEAERSKAIEERKKTWAQKR